MSAAELSSEAIDALIRRYPIWRVEQGRLVCALLFADFPAAFAFMAQVALVAERMGHHPDWRNVYNRVEISLWTHDAGTLTTLDRDLAEIIADAAAGAAS